MTRSTCNRRGLLAICLVLTVFSWAAAIRESRKTLPLPPNAGPGAGPIARIAGKNWGYSLSFPVSNAATIARLIDCESQGLNVGRPDSNGQISWGILQFNGTSTWQEMERRFHFYGDPRNPSEAIHMADLMISNGLLGRWSCAHSLGLVK